MVCFDNFQGINRGEVRFEDDKIIIEPEDERSKSLLILFDS